MNLCQFDWEESIKIMMTEKGWINDIDNETILGFSLKDANGDEWVRYYDKNTRIFYHFNGSQKIHLENVK